MHTECLTDLNDRKGDIIFSKFEYSFENLVFDKFLY